MLTVAFVYGFKNIQNLIRKMKTGSTGYDFVEIMACPSGCINGGGQLRYRYHSLAPHSLSDLIVQSCCTGDSEGPHPAR